MIYTSVHMSFCYRNCLKLILQIRKIMFNCDQIKINRNALFDQSLKIILNSKKHIARKYNFEQNNIQYIK